jgi:Piezo non-specific cation channel, R-Ras-binding domain
MRCRALDKQGHRLEHAHTEPGDHNPAEILPLLEAAARGAVAARAAPGLAADAHAADTPAGEMVHVHCATARGAGNATASAWGPPMLVAAVERVQSGLLGETLSSVGITGLYVTLVFGLGRFLRLGLINLRMRIPYQDLPNVARLTTLCNDIAVAREEGELLLEEQLFYTLLNIYRSPMVLFEMSRKDARRRGAAVAAAACVDRAST